MNPNVISIMWTVAAFLAGILLSLSFHFFSKKKNSSKSDATENPTPTTPVATAITPSIIRPLSQNYEVLLNFRGTDARKTFTDCLYHRLVDLRVCVFRDNEELHVGEEIHPNLLAAIQTSKISIPIISPDYASSKWCLLELVQILKCKETLGQIVIPIFYHVDPSDVRHQKGSFGNAFSSHKKNHTSEIVQEWKVALKKVASLKALELNNNVDGYEGKLINQVVEKVLADLRKTTMVVPEILVGVQEQAREIMKTIDENSSNDVQVVLIHGMGGIGKTTLAKFLYNQLTSRFQLCGFLESVRETSIQQLQKQLIFHILRKEWPWDIYSVDQGTCIINNTFKGAKVLLVLDDVNQEDQLDALMGRDDLFGRGSIIIITSRKRDVLQSRHAKLIYEMRELDFNQSFQLFFTRAFHRENPHRGEFETIARDIVSTTGGLPLAIVVIGSSLLGKKVDIWKETLKKLKRIPHDKVQSKLKISYDALTDVQKKIFLDIACLCPLMHEFKNFMYMWDDCEYYPLSVIEDLKSLSLIKRGCGYDNKLVMHDQLRQLGREIVKQQDLDLPGKRSILWDPKEACEVLKRNQGTEQIEVLNLASNEKYEENCFTNEQFERLTKLRLLQMNNANLIGNFTNCFLNLRWLQWSGCPSKFRATGFRPINLVVLNLSRSNITEQWGGWKEMKYAEKLKVLELEECHHLKETPDFSAFKELEDLCLYNCKRLRTIHPSICKLTRTLKYFRLSGCKALGELPIEVGRMEELRSISLIGTSIREIPIVEGFMTKLEHLNALFCKKLGRLPDSVGSLTSLKRLEIYGCRSLRVIPKSIGKLKALSLIDLRCTNIEELPESIGNLHNLVYLLLEDTPIKRLPTTCCMLKNLTSFGCIGLHEVPKDIGKLTRLERLFLVQPPISELSILPHTLITLGLFGCSMDSQANLSHLTNLYALSLRDVDVIPELPSRLLSLKFQGCQTLCTLPSSSYLKCLKFLSVDDCNELMDINSLEELKALKDLRIRKCKFSKLCHMGDWLTELWLDSCNGLKGLLDLSTLKHLEVFSVVECNNIVKIQGLDTIKRLLKLNIHDCSSLKRIGDLSHMTTLEALAFGNCPKLRETDYPCIDKFTSLKCLCLYGGSPASKLPDFPTLISLDSLYVVHFEELRQIPNLQLLKSLRWLVIEGCKSLEKLPDFSEFTNLITLDVQGCEKLKELKGLESLDSFFSLRIFGCRSLKQLPKLREGRIKKNRSNGSWWRYENQFAASKYTPLCF